MAWSIGAPVFLAESSRPVRGGGPDTYARTVGVVTGVGKKWVRYGEGPHAGRFSLEDGEVDFGDFSTGNAWAFPTREARDEFIAMQTAWHELRRLMRETSWPPPGLTSAAILPAVEAIRAAVEADGG